MNSKKNGKLADMNDSGMSYGDIAEETGLSVQAVRGRIRRYREAVKERAEHSGVEVEQQSYMERKARESGIDPSNVSSWWHKTSKDADGLSVSLRVQQAGVDMGKWRDELIADMQQYSPVYPELKRWPSENGHLLVIDLADLHIGKLADATSTGSDYNSDIAVQRALEGVAKLLDRAAGFNVERILFIAGNDITHVDGARHTTTSLTQMIASEMWYKSFTTAKRLYIELTEMMMQVADVHFSHTMSNHDEATGFFLAETLAAWFRNSKNVTFDVSPKPRKYFQYHKNLIGTTHGHGAKADKLPLLMADEAAHLWAESPRRHFLVHHLHSKIARDYGSVTVEHVRSLSGTDDWHNQKGFRSPAGVEAWLFCRDAGQVARFTHLV